MGERGVMVHAPGTDSALGRGRRRPNAESLPLASDHGLPVQCSNCIFRLFVHYSVFIVHLSNGVKDHRVKGGKK